MKKKYTIIAAIVAAVLAFGVFVIIRGNKQHITIDINREGLSYTVCCWGCGPKRLNYCEHQEAIDCVVEMVSGEYVYQKTWIDPGMSGGWPNSIYFFTEKKEKMYEIHYIDGFIAIPTNKVGKYYLYKKIGKQISFGDFEEYLSLHGVYQRTIS